MTTPLTMSAERERAFRAGMGIVSPFREVLAELDATRARLAEAEAALRKYGRHINACRGGDGCDCGGKDVAAALLAPERPA